MPYKDNTDRRAAYARNHKKILARNAKWRAENGDKVKAGKVRYYADPSNRAKCSQRDARYRADHPEKVKSNNLRYQAEHREELKLYYKKYNAMRAGSRKQWRTEHQNHIKAVAAQYRAKNHAKLLARSAQYDAMHKWEKKDRDAKRYAANREAMRMRGREYSKNHPDEERARRVKYHLANRERLNAKSAAYLATHPEVFLQKCARRRALKNAATVGDGKQIAVWMKSWRRKRLVTCYWCSNKFSGKSCHMDHIVPLSKGGAHTLSNLCVSCPTCNLGKNAKLPMIWNRTLEQPRLFL